MRSRSTPSGGARVRVTVGAGILHPDNGIRTRFGRAVVGQAAARAVVETHLSTSALRLVTSAF